MNEKQGLLVREDTSKTIIALEHLLDLTGECMQTLDNLVAALSEHDTVFRKLESHHDEGVDLQCLRLKEHA